jgi:hypothetical protein
MISKMFSRIGGAYELLYYRGERFLEIVWEHALRAKKGV